MLFSAHLFENPPFSTMLMAVVLFVILLQKPQLDMTFVVSRTLKRKSRKMLKKSFQCAYS